MLYKWKHVNGLYKELILEMRLNLWFKWISPKWLLAALAKTASHLHAMIMHHIVAYACVLIVGTVLLDRSCSEECSRVPVCGAVPPCWSTRQANPPCSFRYNPTLLLLLSFIALGQQWFNCYFCCGSWTHSSAWPVIATVNSWNPLSCVGVDWRHCCVLLPCHAFYCLEYVRSDSLGMNWSVMICSGAKS